MSLAAAILLNAVLAIIWTGILTHLVCMAQAGSFHYGTFFVSTNASMQIFSLVSVLIMVWASYSYRSNHASLTETARFLARLPLGVLMALNLAYWGIRAFMSGF